MKIHHTKGIVLKTVKYGESSIITTIYTEMFGLQTYMVKGVRSNAKKGNGKFSFFQPSSVLDLQVYHNTLKNIQFIKEFQWSILYQHIFVDVLKYSVAMYLVELITNTIKQPEINAELYFLLEDYFIQIDTCTEKGLANLPIFFAINFCKELGFGFQGNFSDEDCILDLKEGTFVSQIPHHTFFVENKIAESISIINENKNIHSLENLSLNKVLRRNILKAIHEFYELHIADFKPLKSIGVLQSVLN